MQTKLNPYIGFKNTAREAMEFYKTVFNGELELHTFKEYNASEDPAEDDKIMHSVLKTENNLVIMASDTPNSMTHTEGSNISISLGGDNDAELRGYFEKLAAEGKIAMPLMLAPWGDSFGMCTDKFGVSWMVNISPRDNTAEKEA